jgi:hypothetical protein
VEQQSAAGWWRLTPEVAEASGVTVEGLSRANAGVGAGLTDDDDDEWATAVVLATLAGKFAEFRGEWEMAAEKAEAWLRGRGRDVAALVARAAVVLEAGEAAGVCEP